MSDPGSATTDLTGSKIGEYEIVARLGVGGMGIVYEGRQPLIGKRVAVKVLLPTLSADRELVERFISEARAVNEIGHRGIVDIFSFGQLPSGQHYFVMEYLNGQPFDQVIKDRAPLQPAEAMGWIEEVCEALQQAHDAGIIHRDIKPSNLFLVDGGRGRRYVKLLDFGIAKLGVLNGQATPQTRASMVIGTPDYMSPEQARAKTITAATDVYALGCVLFEMVTGRRPFKGESSIQTMFMHVEDVPPKASSFTPGLPAELDDLLLWTMEKDPAKRPLSAEELRHHLAAIRATLPEPTVPSYTPPPGTGRAPGVPTPSGRSPSGRTLPLPRSSTPSPRVPAASTPAPVPTQPQFDPTALRPVHRASEDSTELRPAAPASTATRPGEPVSAHTVLQPLQGPQRESDLEPLVIQKSKAPIVVVGVLVAAAVLGGAFVTLRGGDKPDPPTVVDVTPQAATPVDAPVVDAKAADAKAAEAAEAKAAEAKAAEAKAAEAKAAEAKAVDKKAAEKNAAEAETRKPAEQKVATAKTVEAKPAGGPLSAEAIAGRIDKLEKKLAQKEAASGDPDRVLRQFIAQAKLDAAAANTDAKKKDLLKVLDEIQRQLGGR